MKKKIFLFIGVISLILFSGCFFKGDSNLVDSFKKKVTKSNNYYLSGELEIINNEDIYSYIVEVAYKKDDNFRVELKNKTNDHEQIILKNEEGVFVLTPSLNKSFKFQSDWPYNNSQSYLLQTLIQDIENEDDLKVEDTEDGCIVTTKVNYSNNKSLVSQNIYLDKDANIVKVEVMDAEGIVKIKMTFTDVDTDTKFDDDYFDLNSNMEASKTEDLDKTLNSLTDIVYPMYLPDNTYLKSQDKVSKEDGERVILTFSGDSPFTLVEETVNVSKEYETILSTGEPTLLLDTIGIVADKTVSWYNNGIEYFLTSDTLDETKLMEVVNSVNSVALEK